MWLPAMVTGSEWAAVANCGLSIAICVRNFRTRSTDPDGLGELDLREQRAVVAAD